MASEQKQTRRRYSAAMKAQVIAQCDASDASVAKIAMAHGINANVVHRWRQLARDAAPCAALKPAAFIALPLAPSPPTPTACADVRIELRRGATTMTLSWPVLGAADLAAWTREVLR